MNLENYFYYFCYYGEILSYKNICLITGEVRHLGSSSKKAQIKRWRRIAILEKINSRYKFVRMLNEDEIKEIKMKMKETKLRVSDNYKQSCIDNFKQLNLSLENMHKSGVYKIESKDEIYIGQTNNFYSRFIQHWKGYSKNGSDTSGLLKRGGVFSVIELENDKVKRLSRETFWINKFREDPKYKCINKSTGRDKKVRFKVSIIDAEEVTELLKEKGINYEI